MNKKTNANKALAPARKNPNDEFYTNLSDIETELSNYWNVTKTKTNYFKDKVVFCNCDDPEESNFWKYFVSNYDEFDMDGEPCGLGIKKVISTHYSKSGPSYKLEFWKDENGYHNIKTPLIGNGDFQSEECIEILKECDIVCTNPPFSLFKEFVNTILKYNKKFLIIGPELDATHKELFNHFKTKKIWFGYNTVKQYIVPGGGMSKKFNNHRWFTNIPVSTKVEKITLVRNFYNEDGTETGLFKYYDNYKDTIECVPFAGMPKDYFKYMGVPTTFFTSFDPEQFVIIGCTQFSDYAEPVMDILRTDPNNNRTPYINGEKKFVRIIIRRKYKDDDRKILNTDCDYLEKNIKKEEK